MGLKNISTAFDSACLSIFKVISHPKFKKVATSSVAALLFVGLMASASSLGAQNLSTTLSGAVAGDGNGWLLWCIRIVGGFMVLGGLLAAISGFNGNEEGYGKVVKVGGGVVLLLIGGYMVGQAPTLITSLKLNNMFSAV